MYKTNYIFLGTFTFNTTYNNQPAVANIRMADHKSFIIITQLKMQSLFVN